MNKSAETTFPIHEIIAERWSPVAFDSSRPVETEKLGSLLEAARWAASSYNEQPWAYIVATNENPDEHQRMLNCLVEGNIPWAKDAPVLMIAIAKEAFEKNGKPNKHFFHDVGQANANLSLQATALGLVAHQMAGFDADKAKSVYKVPEGWQAATAIAVGYPGKMYTLSESLQKRDEAPRSRKPLSEFVFQGSWGSTLPFDI